MKLDYIDEVNAYGDNMVRLYDFDVVEANKFNTLIEQLIVDKQPIQLENIDFIEARNCSLVLQIADIDEGITTEDEQNFVCDLTVSAYQQMLQLLAPFCKKNTKGHQFLYDVDSPTDFLFSPAGTW